MCNINRSWRPSPAILLLTVFPTSGLILTLPCLLARHWTAMLRYVREFLLSAISPTKILSTRVKTQQTGLVVIRCLMIDMMETPCCQKNPACICNLFSMKVDLMQLVVLSVPHSLQMPFWLLMAQGNGVRQISGTVCFSSCFCEWKISSSCSPLYQ